MEQKTTTTPPQWVEDMQKWQKEDIEHRSVMCVATDRCDTYGAIGGFLLPLVTALLANTIQEECWGEVIKAVHFVKTNPLALETLLETWTEFKKEHGFPIYEREQEKKSSVRSSLKDLFQTLADKL
ncbi:MAG: hypothetical protein K2J58_07130 [Muribaculaceae bacterium]|nr:hypothetical protein [Muribaculaceae bacterium]